MKNKNKHYR